MNAAQSSSKFDYDLLIIGAGVGGHGAALHAIESVSACPLDHITFLALHMLPQLSTRAPQAHSPACKALNTEA